MEVDKLSFKRKALITLIAFLFIFNVPFRFLPFATGKIFTLWSIFILCYFLHKKKHLLFINNRTVKYFFFFSFLLFYYSFMVAILKETYDFTLAYAYFLFFFEYLLGGVVLTYYLSKYRCLTLINLLKVFVWMSFIQAIIIFLMLLIPSLKDLIYSLLRADIRESIMSVNERYGGIRGAGLAASVTYDLSIIQSFALVFINSFYFKLEKNSSKIKYIIMYLIILLSVFVSGRTGWLGIGFSLYLLFAFPLIPKKIRFIFNMKHFKKRVGFLSRLLGMILILVLISFIFLSNDFIELITEKAFPFAFEMFINYYEEGKFETTSSNVVQKMIIRIPSDALLFGHGLFYNSQGGYYMHTDIGYIRHILFYGMVGSLLLYSFYIWLFRNIYIKTRFLYDKRLQQVILILGLYAFIAHIKGDFLVGAAAPVKMFFLIFLIIGNEFKNKLNLFNNE